MSQCPQSLIIINQDFFKFLTSQFPLVQISAGRCLRRPYSPRARFLYLYLWIGGKSLAACSLDVNKSPSSWASTRCGQLPWSVQIASVVLEWGHLDPITQPLDLQVLEIVVFVVLDNDLLQFTNFTLHLWTQLSLHLQQSLQKMGVNTGWFGLK